MKTGRTLNELAAELTRQAETKKDYLADTRALHQAALRHRQSDVHQHRLARLHLKRRMGE